MKSSIEFKRSQNTKKKFQKPNSIAQLYYKDYEKVMKEGKESSKPKFNVSFEFIFLLFF